MGEIASKTQLRMSYLRWAIVSVPGILFLGFLSGQLANSGAGNPWYDMLQKPAMQPPGVAFGIAWSILYVMLGLALAMIVDARGAKGRPVALTLFGVQLLLNLCWSPLFFAWHQVFGAFWLILVILALSIATTFAFAPIRRVAALLMLPYLLWLVFAALLNWQTHVLNPGAELLKLGAQETTIQF